MPFRLLRESAWSALGEEKSILAGDLLQNTRSEEGILKIERPECTRQRGVNGGFLTKNHPPPRVGGGGGRRRVQPITWRSHLRAPALPRRKRRRLHRRHDSRSDHVRRRVAAEAMRSVSARPGAGRGAERTRGVRTAHRRSVRLPTSAEVGVGAHIPCLVEPRRT